MSANPLLIIHGWSDHSTSFINLSQLLQKELKQEIHYFNLADYLSMDDEITFDDIITAMEHAWHKSQLPTKPYSVDVIAHSTGGLIIRDWICRNFTPENCPIKHLVMLAPATFGSGLAHKGQAFIGRVVKGFTNEKMFQVGEKILQGLELGSDYSWNLAMQDRFGTLDYYGPGKILCTVLIGDTGYTGISAAANEKGTDGVIRIAAANMNCSFLKADFSQKPQQPTYQLQTSLGLTAFGILTQENHSSIVAVEDTTNNPLTISSIIGGLTVNDYQFHTWCQQLTELTQNTICSDSENTETYYNQHSVFLVQNQFNEFIKDYFLEFYTPDDNQHWFSQIFHEKAIMNAHNFSQNPSYRSLYINYHILQQQFDKEWDGMCISLTAQPQFSMNNNVGYRTFTDNDIGGIHFSKEQVTQLFIPNQTLLTRIIIRREQAEKVFEIHELAS
ncbi:MAG: hypothetical protein LEGION0398_MBIBDBAK_00660 [Legionellaceae bacterium]